MWPDGAASTVLLAPHGYGDYRLAFGLAGRWLAARGMAVYAYDPGGFGETRMRGRWPGAEALIGDCADAAAVLRAAHPELPLALFGASMGGSVALAGLASGRVGGVDRLIRAAPGVRGGVQLRQLHDLPCAWARSRGSGSGGTAGRPPAQARSPGIQTARRGPL